MERFKYTINANTISVPGLVTPEKPITTSIGRSYKVSIDGGNKHGVEHSKEGYVDLVRAKLSQFSLTHRFADNGITQNTLRTFKDTASEVSPNDTVQAAQLVSAGFTDHSLRLDFHKTELEVGTIDTLATMINSMEIIPDISSPFQFKIATEVNTDMSSIDLRQDNSYINTLIQSIQDKEKPKTFVFALAQQLGHTLAMKGLISALGQQGIAGIEFAIPNPDNSNLLHDEFTDGRALPWRQLYEPGYSEDQSLVLPMNPEDKNYAQTVLYASMLNRHIIALSCAALANGHTVALFNDARHEGPAIFKTVSDWAIKNNPPGILQTFHMGYLLMDPLNALPDQVTDKINHSRDVLNEKAKTLFPGIAVADGVDFMTWKMQAQLMLAHETVDENKINHNVYYMSSFDTDAHTPELIPDHARKWFDAKFIKTIPEVAACTSMTDSVKTIAFTFGTSGHSEQNIILKQVAQEASIHPEIRFVLMGKGTDTKTMQEMIGEIPENIECTGVIQKDEHDKKLGLADTIVTKTSRNSRNALIPSILSGQGVMLLPPESPSDIPDTVTLFQVSYLRETLMEHALDLTTALHTMEKIGIKDPGHLVWDKDRSIIQTAKDAKRASVHRAGEVITPDILADIILDTLRTSK